MRHIFIQRVSFILTILIASVSMLCAQISYQIGDIYTFPDGSKGVVCYVNPDNPAEGWAVALNDVGNNGGERYTMMLSGNAIPSGITQHPYNQMAQYSEINWVNEGWENTRILRESGVSPAANAVDFYDGWYIPDAVQMRMIFSLIPVIGPVMNAAGGNVNQLYNPGRDYLTSTRVGNGNMVVIRGTQYFYDNVSAYNTKAYIRAVRNFNKNDAYAYWIKKYEEEGVKSGSMQVSPTVTTTYDAAVVFGTDTFYVSSTVTVHETFDKDTLYDTVCSSPLLYTSTVNPIFENLDISNPRDYIIRHTLQTVYGCDSIITLMLHVRPSYLYEERDTICLSDTPYVWTNHNVVIPTEVGDHVVWDSSTTSLGCDSVYKLLLKIVPMPDLEVTPTEPVCAGNELQLSASATQCSSFAELYREDFNRVKGNSGTDISGKLSSQTDWMSTGTKVYSFGDTAVQVGSGSAVGWIKTKALNLSQGFSLDLHLRKYRTADSPVSLEIRIDDVIVDTITVDDGDFEHYVLNYAQATAHSTLEFRTLNTGSPRVVLNEMVIYDNSPCTYVWNINGELKYSADTLIASPEAGVYRVRAISARGCISEDSVRVKPNAAGTDAREVCENELPVTWNGVNFTEAGTQSATITATNGCDSVVTMTLTVNPLLTYSDDTTLCANELPYTFHGHAFDAAGTLTETVPSLVTGCDSTWTLTVNVNPTLTYSDDTTLCANELPYTFHGHAFTAAGTLTETVPSLLTGCDSTWTLTVNGNPTLTYSDDTTLGANELPYTVHGHAFTAAGTLTETVPSLVTGCDSTWTLTVNVNPTYNVTDAKTICESELPYIWNGVTFTAAGIQTATLPTVNNCDSIVTMTLTVDNLSLSVISHDDEVCGDDGSLTVAAADGLAPIEYSLDGVNYQSSNEFSGLSDGNYTIYAKDANNCEATADVVIAPAPIAVLTLTCPPTYYDTLAYGDCVMEIYPEAFGTPTATIYPAEWPFEITNEVPADNLYYEGTTVVTYTMKDSVCGNTVTCDQYIVVVFPQCPDAVDCEGNVYHGVRIGCDCWTQTNLLSNCYGEPNECVITGTCDDPIPCVYEYESDQFPDVDQNVEIYGRLYCAEAALDDSVINENGHIQGICPEGWYLPTPEQYEQLYLYGGGTSILTANGLRSDLYWIDGGGDNATGFSALPAGFYNGASQQYERMTLDTYFWATEVIHGEVHITSYRIQYNCSEIQRVDIDSGYGISVRCVKEKN